MFEGVSGYGHLISLDAETLEALVKKLVSIKSPYKIISQYGMDGRHYVLISADRNLKIKRS